MASGNEVIESAKAIQEVAKTTGKAIDATSGFGQFINRVFGGLVEDGVGLVADRLKFYRQEKAIKLQERVEQLLSETKVDETRAIPPRVAVPLIEAATLADDSRLSESWARLLRNGLDPNFKGEVSKRFVSILDELEPDDAAVFDAAAKAWQESHKNILIIQEKLAAYLGISADRIDLALRNLHRLGLIKPGVQNASGVSVGGVVPTQYMDLDMFALTPLGVQFYKAIQ